MSLVFSVFIFFDNCVNFTTVGELQPNQTTRRSPQNDPKKRPMRFGKAIYSVKVDPEAL